MRVSSDALKDGVFLDKYGKRGDKFLQGMPCFSIPVKIEDAPKEAKSFAIILIDPDSVEACGIEWIHWLAANITRTEIGEGESTTATDFVQGENTWGQNVYGGMAPPDRPHAYELYVYALDYIPELYNGFTLEELQDKMYGHIVDKVKLVGMYNN